MTHGRESGFSTLEVIAAVVIVAVALVPILSLHTQLTRGQIALAERQADSTALQNALALTRDVNPMLQPQGRRQLDPATIVSWTSTPISPRRQSVNPAGFEVQLYRIDARIEGQGAVRAFQFELIGWRPAAGEPVTE